MSEEHPRPWYVQVDDESGVATVEDDHGASVLAGVPPSVARLIVRACNSHDALVSALQEVLHHADDECGFIVQVRAALALAGVRP